MALKLILNDATEIELQEAGLSQHYVVLCSSRTAFQRLWGLMTDENLAEIQIKEDDTVIQTIIGEFTQQDAEYTEAGRILLGEEE